MKAIPVNSSHNNALKRVRALHQRGHREKEHQFIIEGIKLLREAVAKGIRILDVVTSEAFWQNESMNTDLAFLEDSRISTVHVADDKLFKELITTQTSCGIVAVGEQPEWTLQDCIGGSNPFVLVGEAIQDPGNAGTLVRAALAFGCTGLIFSKGSVDAFNPKVVRSAMGALFELPVITGLELTEVMKQIKEKSIRTIALEPTASTPLDVADLSGPIAILLGNEGNGLTESGLALADELVTIPISQATESLNVAMCGAIVLYQCALQRRK